MDSVGAPGRCRLASASRRSGLRGRCIRRARSTMALPAPRNSSSVANAPSTNHAAKSMRSAVSTAVAARIMNAPATAAMKIGFGRVVDGAATSRSSAAAGTSRARASGHSAKASAVSRPYTVARMIGPG